MKKFRAAANAALWVLSSFILLFAISLIVMVLLGCKLFAVQTGSMEPTYRVGSLVVVEPAAQSDIRKGDVVTFISGSVTVTHRVVSVEPDGTFITKGDNNAVSDAALLPYENIIGRVRFGVPLLGYPVLLASTRAGRIMIISGVLLVALLSLLCRYIDADDDDEDEEAEQNDEEKENPNE